jgi:type I restriction enzyme S subunit
MKKLNKIDWPEVYYGDYVDHIEVNEKDPEKRRHAKYVSVEHIETGKLIIESWETEEMPTFFRTFQPGQILFGKRRAYQRKVAVATFSGICSPHVWALKTKKDLQQELLPFLMLTDRFYEYVNANSAGTMSVYLKWPQLSKYKFFLPHTDEQNKIIEFFTSLENSINHVIEQEKYLQLLLENINNELINEESKIRRGDLIKIEFGEIALNISERVEPRNSLGQIFVGLEHIDSGEIKIERYGKPDNLIGTKLKVYEGDIIFGKRNAYLRKAAISDFNGICSAHAMVLRSKEKNILKEYLPYFMHTNSFMFRAKEISEGSISPTIKWKNLERQQFYIPKIEDQRTFTKIFQKSQIIRQQLKEQKANLKTLKQQLLNEILG